MEAGCQMADLPFSTSRLETADMDSKKILLRGANMQIHDKYIIYSPQKTESGKPVSKKTKPTPGMLQREALDVLSFYGDAGKIFSAMTSKPSAEKTSKPTEEKKEAEKTQKSGKAPEKLEIVKHEDAKKIVRKRDGEVLKKGLIVKQDQFPTMHNEKLQTETHGNQPRIPGAPNFRKVEGEPIYGTGQPTIEGIKQVLKEAGAGPGGDSRILLMFL